MGSKDPIGFTPQFSVSDFVAVFNQSIESAYPIINIIGEIANFKISKNRWLYFDLKDEYATVSFFGNVGQLPGPLEDGLMVEVVGKPRLHQKFGFNISVEMIKVSGEGSIQRAQDLLSRKLKIEGLFDESRKRVLPYPPKDIGVISSSESAGFADFKKILSRRWPDIDIIFADVLVQGENAPEQIVDAVSSFNELKNPPEVLVVIRGGGSKDDLAVFSDERVVRAIAGSRVRTLVAIGHETDESLAELVADKRASTPSNGAEILAPDRKEELELINSGRRHIKSLILASINYSKAEAQAYNSRSLELLSNIFDRTINELKFSNKILKLLDPKAPFARGYSLAYTKVGKLVRSTKNIKKGDRIDVVLIDGIIKTKTIGLGKNK